MLSRHVRFHTGRTVAEGEIRVSVVPKLLREEIAELTGADAERFPVTTRIFDFELEESDAVIAREAENGFPLIVRRGEEVIVNLDLRAAQAIRFADSKRPVYTYIPGFHIQRIPTAIRRPVSNIVKSTFSSGGGDARSYFRKLPLTGFEFVIFLLAKVLANGTERGVRPFRWPSGKRAVFVSLHDVDTAGFLRRKERDPLFRLEQKHGIRSTWFIPTALLPGKDSVDFLLRSGHEVGWHGHNHDHRLPFPPYAERRVMELKRSFLSDPENHPTGMRTPRLLKSNHLYSLLERNCPAMCFDTSFAQGIVPYYLWVNGRQSKILEIPTTVPTDIGVYHKAHRIPRSRRFDTVLEVQIERTKKLIDVSGIISIVTHPETDLTEQPEFMDNYDRYLSYIKGCSDVWFATAGELYRYWTGRSGIR
jgi:peptidoglycan/xylan/chitin deacetylase (PgdA/CDA1 family)